MNSIKIAIKNKTNLTLQLEKKYDVTYYEKQTFFSKVLLKKNTNPDIYFHKGFLSSEAVGLIESAKIVIVSSNSVKKEIIDKVSNIDIEKLHVQYPYFINKIEYEKSIKKEILDKTKELFIKHHGESAYKELYGEIEEKAGTGGTWEPCHKLMLGNGITGWENVGGDLERVVGKRFKIMGFPIRWVEGDGSMVRLVAEIDEDELNDVPTRIYKYGDH